MPTWTLAELTELDLHLQEPGSVGAGPRLSGDRHAVLRQWLEQRRVKHPQPAAIARHAVQVERGLRLGLASLGLVSGWGAAKALLWYDGTQLINVSTFWVTLILTQALLLAGMLAGRALLQRRAGQSYTRLLQRWGKFHGSLRSLPGWRLRGFASLQWMAVAFNAGALACTAFEGITRDLAFGWATTLPLQAGQVADGVRLLSRPWGGAWTPTPEQISASRIVLIEGTRSVQAQAASAWWPFLLMSLLVYGLLPRLLLAAAGEMALRLNLRKPRLDDAGSERLYLQLTRPQIGFQPAPQSPPDSLPDGIPLPSALQPQGPVHLLRDPELDSPQLPAAVARQLGVPVSGLQSPADPVPLPPAGGLAWLLEAWQPPLQEHLATLQSLRQTLGPETDLLILLCGLPEDPETLAPPEPKDVRLWQAHLATLRDPRLGILPCQNF